MSEMQRARLIPVSGISSSKEAEQRATSALLAVISIVREFSDGLVGGLGASKARKALVETFTEVEVKLPNGQKVRPDGLIRVSYGSGVWSALVEVKTGDSCLDAVQLNNYLTAAKEIDADTVISISNEIGVAGAHPTQGLNVRSNSKVRVHHYSWTRILAIAVQNKVHAGVADPEQAWILGELIRYLEHSASGASQLADMGPSWVTVRDGARERSLKKSMPEVSDIAARWDQLIREAALQLSSETGADVQQLLPRAQQDPKARLGVLCDSLVGTGQLAAELRVPDTAGDLCVIADIRARQLCMQVTIDAPGDKKGRGSVSWLTRQLKDAPGDLTIEAFARNARTPETASLSEATEDSNVLIGEGKSDVSKFRISMRSEAGQSGRSGGRRPGFIDTVDTCITSFYQLVLQQITPWVAPAPKVKRPPQIDTAPQPVAPHPAHEDPPVAPIAAGPGVTPQVGPKTGTPTLVTTEPIETQSGEPSQPEADAAPTPASNDPATSQPRPSSVHAPADSEPAAAGNVIPPAPTDEDNDSDERAIAELQNVPASPVDGNA